MENASKALIMAAGVLLGIMIISIGVALFSSFSEFSRSTLQKVEDAKIAEWNNNYLKYYGNISRIENGKVVTEPIKVTAHDIVTVVNHARQNNEKYNLSASSRGDENTYYVQVKLDGKSIETWTEKEKNDFLKDNSMKITKDSVTGEIISTETKYYKCSEEPKEPKISPVTKRVICIEFEEY